jgi:chromate reductase
VRVLGIAGSLRNGSHNRTLLRVAAEVLPEGVEFAEWSGLAELPAYDEDIDALGAPPAVAEFRQAIEAADAVIIATPEYNGSVPGALKNALDWGSRPWPGNSLRGAPVCVIGASTGLFGAVWAQAELRKILTTIGADVMDTELPLEEAHRVLDQDGRLADPRLRVRLRESVAALIERATPGPMETARC